VFILPHEVKALLEPFCHWDIPIIWIGQMTRTIQDEDTH